MKLPDVIKDTRAHILTAILAAAWLLSHDAVHHNTCRLSEAPTAEQEICTATNSLAYQRFLNKHGLLPVSTSFQSLRTTLHSLTCSVTQLVRLLTGDEMFEGLQETYGGVDIVTSAIEEVRKLPEKSASRNIDRIQPAIRVSAVHGRTCHIGTRLKWEIDDILDKHAKGVDARDVIAQLRANAGMLSPGTVHTSHSL